MLTLGAFLVPAGRPGRRGTLIFPVSVSVPTNAFPAAPASHAIGWPYGIAGLGNTAVPLVGGLLTQTLGWRWIFWLLVPLALAAFVIAALTVPESGRLGSAASMSPVWR